MKIKNPLTALPKFSVFLWTFSMISVVLSFALSSFGDYLTFISSAVGVTALIFIANGMVLGQILTIIFATLYGIVSIIFGYWGEALTYLGMSLPAATAATISWVKNPYKDTGIVKIRRMSTRKTVIMFLLSIPVTVIFYFALGALSTPNLVFSTLSVTTSFIAAYLSFMRSPFFALAYVLNDIVLVVLWALASAEDISYLPMVTCFTMFLFNDTYSFINWKKMQQRQLSKT